MNYFKFFLIPAFLVLMMPAAGRAQTATPTATLSAVDIEKEQLDIEKLKLENENLKLQLQKAQMTPTPLIGSPSPTPTPQEAMKDRILDFQQAFSDKAQVLAKAHAGEEDLLILDFVNAELWYKGTRYGINELPVAADDQKWKVDKRLDERMANGIPRWRYQVANALLLKYESRDRGVFEITPPQKPGDFRILTPDGISFDSSTSDIRDAAQNLYLKYNGQDETDGLRTIRYEHGRDLSFSDKLEFLVTRDGKIQKIRYGTLDER